MAPWALLGFLLASISVSNARQLPLSEPRSSQSYSSASVDQSSIIIDSELSEWINELSAQWGGKGIGIAVVRKLPNESWSIETKGFGPRNGRGEAVDENTLFSICSNTKLFTTMALGMLVEDPSLPDLTWESKVTDLVSDELWSLQDHVASKGANLIDVLSHRTGLAAHDWAWTRSESDVKSILSRLKHLRPSAELREHPQYNNYHYALAGELVSKFANVSYVEYVKERLFHPLGLDSATFNADDATATGNVVAGHPLVAYDVVSEPGSKEWFSFAHRPFPLFLEDLREPIHASGGILMSVRDVATWLQTLLLKGVHPTTGHQVIPRSAIEFAETGRVIWSASPSGGLESSSVLYGAAQMISWYQGHRIVEHTGGWSGHRSVLARAPDDNVAVAVLTNFETGARLMQVIKFRILEKLLNLPVIDHDARARASFRREFENQKDRTPPRPESPPSAAIREYAGKYHNEAYGNISFCVSQAAMETASARICQLAIQEERIMDGRSASPSWVGRTTLIASLPDNQFVNHIRLEHFAHDTFNLTRSFVSRPFSPDGTSPQRRFVDPFLLAPVSNAEFVVDDEGKVLGVGLSGVWEAWSSDALPLGSNHSSPVQQRSEVWFDRIE